MRLRKDWRAFIIFGLSIYLWAMSVWQLEIIAIWIAEGKEVWEFPFFLWQTNTWMARDIWYLVNGIAVLMPLVYILHEKDSVSGSTGKL